MVTLIREQLQFMGINIKKAATPKALFMNMIWLSALLTTGYFVLQWIDPYDEKAMEKRASNYKVLEKQIGLDVIIKNVYDHRGASGIEVNDSLGYFIKHSRNYDYNEPWLDDFLQVGDHLLKSKNSDTLWIERESSKYYFVIGEFINEKK